MDEYRVLLKEKPINLLLGICTKINTSVEEREFVRKIYPQVGDSALWDAAQLNKIEPVVARTLVEALDEPPPGHWNDAHLANSEKMASYFVELDRVATALRQRGIKVILLENGALARAIVPSPALFRFGDFDLLVDPKWYGEVHQELLILGYVCQSFSKNGRLDFSDGRLVYEIALSGTFLRLNIQSSFVARRMPSPWQEPDIDMLFEHALPVSGSHILILGVEQFLLQLCIHNAAHGFIRQPGIRLHMDMDWFIRSVSVNWDRFAKLVKSYRVTVASYVALAIPRAIWATPIPEATLAVLRPGARKARRIVKILERYDLFDIREPKFNRLDFLAFNFLLLDDLKGFWCMFFPNSTWIRQHYQLKNDQTVFHYQVLNLWKMLFQRFGVRSHDDT